MAYEISGYAVKVTRVAGADLSSAQYTFVKQNSNGEVIAVAAATDKPLGILQNAPKSGQEAEVLVVGGSKLVLGGTLTPTSVLGTSSAGAGVALTVGTDTTKYILGQVLLGGASGEIGTVVVDCAAAGRAA